MARTVVYPHTYKSPVNASSEAETTEAEAPGAGEKKDPGDSYTDKLAKFIPGEIVAFFAPAAALVADRTPLLITAAIIGLLATPAYLWRSARDLEENKKPRWYFYLLASISFAVWAMATSKLGTLIGLDSIGSSFILGVTVFAVPFLDDMLTPKPPPPSPDASGSGTPPTS